MVEQNIKRKKEGEVIFCEYEPGETLFFLKEGEVKLVKVITEKEKTLAILKKGDIFGEMSVIKKMPRSATAIAQTDIELLELNRDSFFQLVQKKPAVGFRLLKIFATRLRDQKRKIQTLSIKSPDGKILDTLLMFFEKGEGKMISDTSVQLKISISSLAGWTGLPFKECSNTLDYLKSSGKLEVHEDEHIIIPNIESVKTFLHSKINSD